MSERKSSTKKSLLVEDPISVEDILLEHIFYKGWKDYRRFARTLTQKIVGRRPTTEISLEKLIIGMLHPFFAFNGITRRQFLVGFPAADLLRVGTTPRLPSSPKNVLRSRNRKTIPKKLRFLVMERDQFHCQLCGKTAKESKLEVDHKIPLARGGTDSLNNMWTLCFACNRGKSDLSVAFRERE